LGCQSPWSWLAIRRKSHRGGESEFALNPRTSLLTSTSQFNHVNSLNLIARAHQLVQEGFKHMFDDHLVTVWSAPNYCYRCGNLASIMQVGDNSKTDFRVYEAAHENQTDQKNPALRRIVSVERTSEPDRNR
jgi:hypothetical protein